MDMKTAKRRFAFSLLVGLVVTTVTGMLTNTAIAGSIPDIVFTGDGANYWGYAFPWLRQASPDSVKDILWRNFIADVLIWTLFAYAVFSAANVPRRAAAVRSAAHQAAQKKRARR